MKAIFERQPLLTYFGLTFVISWGGILIVLGPSGFTAAPEQLETLLPFVVLAILAGPAGAGILTTGLIDGWAGLRALGLRLLRWRVDARWYAVALLTAPLTVLATLLTLSLISPVFLPNIFTASNKASLLLAGVAAGLAGGFLEELGWTGSAIPRLRQRYGALTTGLIAGFGWGAWHFPTALWGSSDFAGDVPLAIYLAVVTFSFLVPYRVLMVQVYDRTESLPVTMLMHASLVPSIFFVLMPPATGWACVTYHVVLAAALWGVVAALAMTQRRGLAKLASR